MVEFERIYEDHPAYSERLWPVYLSYKLPVWRSSIVQVSSLRFGNRRFLSGECEGKQSTVGLPLVPLANS